MTKPHTIPHVKLSQEGVQLALEYIYKIWERIICIDKTRIMGILRGKIVINNTLILGKTEGRAFIMVLKCHQYRTKLHQEDGRFDHQKRFGFLKNRGSPRGCFFWERQASLWGRIPKPSSGMIYGVQRKYITIAIHKNYQIRNLISCDSEGFGYIGMPLWPPICGRTSRPLQVHLGEHICNRRYHNEDPSGLKLRSWESRKILEEVIKLYN